MLSGFSGNYEQMDEYPDELETAIEAEMHSAFAYGQVLLVEMLAAKLGEDVASQIDVIFGAGEGIHLNIKQDWIYAYYEEEIMEMMAEVEDQMEAYLEEHLDVDPSL